jgi:hypothetical protein
MEIRLATENDASISSTMRFTAFICSRQWEVSAHVFNLVPLCLLLDFSSHRCGITFQGSRKNIPSTTGTFEQLRGTDLDAEVELADLLFPLYCASKLSEKAAKHSREEGDGREGNETQHRRLQYRPGDLAYPNTKLTCLK